jgi:membrane-associated phospholipid phosphatase
MIRKIPRSCLGLFLLLRLRGVSATIRSAMLMLIVALLATSPLPMSAATPDPVLEWIGVMNNAVIAGGTTPLATSRVVALVSASVFDAVNGIDPRFQSLHVRADAPHHASQRAAAIQAAYAILFKLYPAQDATLLTPQFASMTPWVLARPSQFRLPPPLALSSTEYATDLDELFRMGVFSGSGRTPDQSELALFWAGNTALYWNRIAAQLSAAHGLTLTENAHLFALLNVTMADAAIACWDGKYRYVFWRPITAIRDGFTPSDADPTWVPWLDFFPTGTPAHPEYPSGHSTVSGSAAFILSAAFGENTAFSVTSDVRPGTRTFSSFADAVAEVANARVFGGIHFRTSCARANTLGRAVANYVSKHAMRARGDGVDDEED